MNKRKIGQSSDQFIGDIGSFVTDADDACREHIEGVLAELVKYKLPLKDVISARPDDYNDAVSYFNELKQAVLSIPAGVSTVDEKMSYVRNHMNEYAKKQNE